MSLLTFFQRLWRSQLGDSTSEFPQHEGINPHASIWYALPCPKCGKRIASAHFNTHVTWCGAEITDPLYQQPEDQELDY